MEKNELKKSTGNYKVSRFNATRHGILSRHTVLPWESQEEYEELLQALGQDYSPVGTIEAHLLEEIAGIVWRKGRLRLGETSSLRNQYRSLIPSDRCNIAELGLSGKLSIIDIDDNEFLKTVLTTTSAEAALLLIFVQKDLLRSQKALKILEAETPKSYQLALKTLVPYTRKLWEKELADEKYSPSSEDLGKFLSIIIANFRTRMAIFANHSAMIALVHSKSLDPEQLDKFSRYEVFLDRKLERTLSMLLKLQALRRAQETASE